MIKELTWDSAIFKRKIGELIPVSRKPSDIRNVLKKAKDNDFEYLTCRIKSQDTMFFRLLETLGFYVTDIGVILAIKTGSFFRKNLQRELKIRKSKIRKSIKVATCADIPMLKRLVRSLFLESRFYDDPFFTKDEADRLYEAWIENSVKGEAADIVFFIPRIGLLSCRTKGKNSGEIVLVGIRKNQRGKGFGSALVGEAMQWFVRQKILQVSVRTQLKNLEALNFYISFGFLPKAYDIVFGKIL